MGCHTYYKRLVSNNQEEITQKIKDALSISQYYNWYEFTSFDALFKSDEEWVDEICEFIYGSLDGLAELNGIFGIYEDAYDYQTDEPRIGGYPDKIITSAEEMFKVMEEGLVNWEGKHFNFYWDEDREERIRKNITEFFKEHPDGIIEFG